MSSIRDFVQYGSLLDVLHETPYNVRVSHENWGEALGQRLVFQLEIPQGTQVMFGFSCTWYTRTEGRRWIWNTCIERHPAANLPKGFAVKVYEEFIKTLQRLAELQRPDGISHKHYVMCEPSIQELGKGIIPRMTRESWMRVFLPVLNKYGYSPCVGEEDEFYKTF